MSEWRPLDWEKGKYQEHRFSPDYYAGYEDGADAMLKALRKSGTHFDGNMTFNGFYQGRGYGLSNKDNTGTYVFIPDGG